MPPAPSFDYYAALQVESAASAQQLTASYRRLARIHHPDKNPDKTEEATTAFQKIQEAYEVLSDPAQRTRYDARLSSASRRSAPSASAAYAGENDADDIFRSRYDPFGFGDIPGFFNYDSWRGETRPGVDPYDAFYQRERERREERERSRERVLESLLAARRARQEAEDAAKRAKADAKKSEEEAKNEARARRQREERSAQEAIWEKKNARTKDEKLRTCLHSEFCTKLPQKQKFKCGFCNTKRGITAFECPHCATFLCQLCLVYFARERDRAEK
ncbi:hypothetical protein DL764_009796 [Monosporascus ibericus]|uniref:J domain-containing protein n=1 Tax=Monosporascus ibericus TaxID=155417 RepID=A0A4Q4SX43_9PEZI|nr:hypothetical protein DL764_009796 [Monosporascus ibericus]